MPREGHVTEVAKGSSAELRLITRVEQNHGTHSKNQALEQTRQQGRSTSLKLLNRSSGSPTTARQLVSAVLRPSCTSCKTHLAMSDELSGPGGSENVSGVLERMRFGVVEDVRCVAEQEQQRGIEKLWYQIGSASARKRSFSAPPKRWKHRLPSRCHQTA